MLYNAHPFNYKQTSHIDFFLNRLMSMMKSLTSGRLTFTDIDRNIQHLENMIFAYDGKKEAANQIMSCLGKKFLSVLNTQYSAWEAELEKKFFAQAISSPILSLSDYRLFQRIAQLVGYEASLLTRYRNQYDRILYIGCGSVPVSAILLHEILDAPIDCLDIDAIACENATQLLKKWRLNHIDVSHKAYEQVNLNKYDAVIVSIAAQPKYAILDFLYENARPDCNVICQTTYELRSILHDPTPPLYLGQYQIFENYTAESANNVISSLLLRKS